MINQAPARDLDLEPQLGEELLRLTRRALEP